MNIDYGKIHSDVTGKDYKPKETVRLVNLRQIEYYCENNVMPVDIYISRDFKTNKPIVCFLFLRDETKDVYDAWCKRGDDYETNISG